MEEQVTSNTDISSLLGNLGPDAFVVISKRDLEACIDERIQKILSKHNNWIDAGEVSRRFGIPFANIKNAAWRKKVGFPTHQPGGAYTTPMFLPSEVDKWLMG